MPSDLPPGSVGLATGINDYIGSHVADQLLEAGFDIRGEVRDIRKVRGLLDLWEDKFGKDKVGLVAVKDISAPRAFGGAVQGLNTVIPDVVSSIHEILESASRTPTVKSLVYTSSAVALAPLTPSVARRLDPGIYNDGNVKVSTLARF